jgi:hypothetical protein
LARLVRLRSDEWNLSTFTAPNDPTPVRAHAWSRYGSIAAAIGNAVITG